MNFERIKQIAALNDYKLWNVKVGQELEIHEKIKEGNNERIWKFKGLVIKVKKPSSHDGTFTVRGKVIGVNVEKVYPLGTNIIEKMIILDEKKVRRSKLYFIREKIGKDAKLKSLLIGENSSIRGLEIERVSINANLPKNDEKPVETKNDTQNSNEVEATESKS